MSSGTWQWAKFSEDSGGFHYYPQYILHLSDVRHVWFRSQGTTSRNFAEKTLGWVDFGR